jgi:hypothetical protein
MSRNEEMPQIQDSISLHEGGSLKPQMAHTWLCVLLIEYTDIKVRYLP